MKKINKGMRKIYSVILLLAMVIGLFPMGTVEVKASTNATQNKIGYQPLQLSESFLDEKGGNGIGTATDYNVPDKEAVLYPDEYFFYDKSYSDLKGASTYDGYMPESGAIEVGGIPYKFADYEGNDCILLNKGHKTETLELETIGVYEKVYVLATGGGVGASTSVKFKVTLNYTEGASVETEYYLYDWFPYSYNIDKNTMYTEVKRAKTDGTANDAGDKSSGPVLQTSALTVDKTRLLKSITFEYTGDNSGLFCAVFGVTGATPSGVPDAPTALAATGKTSTQKQFTAKWRANGEGDKPITGYYIDVAEDKNFTKIVPGYNNYPITGNVTSCLINGDALEAGKTYYYRVRAKNDLGQSLSSNRVATDLPSWIATAMNTSDHSKVTYDLDTDTLIFNQDITLSNPLTIPKNASINIYLPEGVTVTGAENKTAIDAVSESGETVSLNVYGGGTIKGGNGSDENVSDETPAKPGQPAIDFSQAKGTTTLVVGNTTETTNIIGGDGGDSTTATGGAGGAGIYLSGSSTMQKKGTQNIKGGNGGNGKDEDSNGKEGHSEIRDFTSSDIRVTAFDGTYDGCEHGISVVVPSGAKVTYSRTEGGVYTENYPTETNVTNGNVKVYYKVEKDGYVPFTGFSTIKIAQRNISSVNISASSSSVAYTGEKVEFSLDAITYNGMTLVKGTDYELEGITEGTTMGTYSFVIRGLGNYTGEKEITWYIKDLTAPTGEIKLNEINKWSAFIDPSSILYNLFYSVEQTVTITAQDFGSEVASIQYYVSSSAMSLYNLQNMSYYNWITYNAPVTIQPTRNCIVYAKITDDAGNVTYISSNGIVLDATAPVFNGITNGMSSREDEIKFTVSDLSPVQVFIDGVEVTPVNGKYTISESLREQVVKAVDKVGNTTTITVLVHGDKEAPTGEIKIDDEHKWSSTPQGYREIFFNEAQEITITATDAGIGLEKIEYMITDGLMLSDGSDEGPVWKTYQGPFTLEADGKYVIYARLTDKEDNSTIIISDVIILDATAPVISGIENGKVYCDDKVKFAVVDEYLEGVLINGEVTEKDENGYYIVTVGEDVQVIEAVDKSGNVTTYKITVNGCHTWKEPVVTWAEDELSATFDFVCMYDEEHTRTKEAQATLEIEDGATGSQKGTITHVVKVELDGKAYTAKQVNDTPVVEEEKIGDGKLTAKVEVAEDVPEVVVDNLNVNLVKDLLTEEQLESVETDGSQIEVSLKIETLKDAAPKSDVKLVKDTLATIVKDLTDKNNYVSTEEVKSGIEYIDLSLYMKIDDNPEEKISQLKGKELTITMEIPENIKSDKKGRQYYVIRVHDGAEVEVLDSVIDLEAGTIKFKTDRFSTYAIVYTDVTDAEVNVPEIPKTADSSNVELFVLTLAAGAYMVVCSGKKRSEV